MKAAATKKIIGASRKYKRRSAVRKIKRAVTNPENYSLKKELVANKKRAARKADFIKSLKNKKKLTPEELRKRYGGANRKKITDKLRKDFPPIKATVPKIK